MRYSFLSSNEVHPGEQAVAELLAKIAAHDLGIEPPKVFFVIQDPTGAIETKGGIHGYSASAGYVAIRCGLSPHRLYQVVLHECRHAAQWRDPYWQDQRRNRWAERDAAIYARQWPLIPHDWTYRQLELSLLKNVVAEHNHRVKAVMKPSARLLPPGYEIR